MIDNCSRVSFEDARKSGLIALGEYQYLSVFVDPPKQTYQGQKLTHREATDLVEQRFQKRWLEGNACIVNLEKKGLLRKVDKVQCRTTRKMVNRWAWTGRIAPLSSTVEWVPCSHCGGKGGRRERVYRAENAQQGRIFV